MLVTNTRATRTPYPSELQSIMSIQQTRENRHWLESWTGITHEATPLYNLPGIAQSLGIASFSVKDESVRSSLGSFKSLGAPVALVRLIKRLHADFDTNLILTGRYAAQLKNYTVISATDGNHGRSLAAAARDAGCRCVIVLHTNVSMEREDAIAELGAEIVRIQGNYDISVEEAARLAKLNGWQVVSDTSYEGYEAIPRDVMQGYGTIAAEIIEQTQECANEAGAFTHIFLQGGVGGMAAGLISYFWEHYGQHRPHFIVVEPAQADCLTQSAMQGKITRSSGSVDSVMAGLACGEASPLAWKFLDTSVDHFMTIEDSQAIEAMRILAQGSDVDTPIVAGESAVVGLAAMQILRHDVALSAQVSLDEKSKVLIISTEGATAPKIYQELVGESAKSVKMRQDRWLDRFNKQL